MHDSFDGIWEIGDPCRRAEDDFVIARGSYPAPCNMVLNHEPEVVRSKRAVASLRSGTPILTATAARNARAVTEGGGRPCRRAARSSHGSCIRQPRT
eukprot:1347478-Prymnesium_polylepis.1